jgi:hypothetical protein
MEREGTTRNRKSDDGVSGGVVQLVRRPACHAGGRGFEARRSRQLFTWPVISRTEGPTKFHGDEIALWNEADVRIGDDPLPPAIPYDE